MSNYITVFFTLFILHIIVGIFMVVPIIILSIVYELLFSSGFEAINIVDGIGLFVSSFIFGYFSLYFLVQFLKKFDFWWFGLYCIIVSIIS